MILKNISPSYAQHWLWYRFLRVISTPCGSLEIFLSRPQYQLVDEWMRVCFSDSPSISNIETLNHFWFWKNISPSYAQHWLWYGFLRVISTPCGSLEILTNLSEMITSSSMNRETDVYSYIPNTQPQLTAPRDRGILAINMETHVVSLLKYSDLPLKISIICSKNCFLYKPNTIQTETGYSYIPNTQPK